MVGKAEHGQLASTGDDLVAALREEYPELRDVSAAAGSTPVYAVGGAVRDLLLGRPRADLDLVVEGDPYAIADRLGGATSRHDRFLTAAVWVDGLEVDLARARTETYPYPGALPEVAPADLASDLDRRDFTVNAMALPIESGTSAQQLIDPHGGYEDLRTGILRALHRRSFLDDPTRVLRGARYAASYNLQPDEITAEMIAGADIAIVSDERREAELQRIATDPEAIAALHLLEAWGVLEAPPGGIELAQHVRALASTPPWKGEFDPAAATLRAITDGPEQVAQLADLRPRTPLDGVEAAERHDLEELAVARAMGAEWLDEYLQRWRGIELAIDGRDLIAAGVPQGPAVGRGLREARRRKLTGEVDGREGELEAALEGAGRDGDALG